MPDSLISTLNLFAMSWSPTEFTQRWKSLPLKCRETKKVPRLPKRQGLKPQAVVGPRQSRECGDTAYLDS